MNVETVRRDADSSERYSFRPTRRGAWSLEHIHAQNAEQLNTRRAVDGVAAPPPRRARATCPTSTSASATALIDADRRSARPTSPSDSVPRVSSSEIVALFTRRRRAGRRRRRTRSPTSRCSPATTTARSATRCSRSSGARSSRCDRDGSYIPVVHPQRVPEVLHRRGRPADPLLEPAGSRRPTSTAMLEQLAPYLTPEEVDA